MQVYLVNIAGDSAPVELTDGDHGAIHSPVLNIQGTKAAWLELAEDGYESDRLASRYICHNSHLTTIQGQDRDLRLDQACPIYVNRCLGSIS